MYQTSPFPNTNNNNNKKSNTRSVWSYSDIHMYSKSKTHSSYFSMKMHLQNKLRQERNLFKKRLLSSFFLSFFLSFFSFLSFLNMKKTPILKALALYSFKHYNKWDSLSTTLSFHSFMHVCERVFFICSFHSFIL